MSLSAIISVSGTDPQKEAHVQIFKNKSTEELINTIFDRIFDSLDSDDEAIITDYETLKQKWISHYTEATKAPKVKKFMDEMIENHKHSHYQLHENEHAGEGTLIAIDIRSSYDTHYYLIDELEFVDGVANISVYEH